MHLVERISDVPVHLRDLGHVLIDLVHLMMRLGFVSLVLVFRLVLMDLLLWLWLGLTSLLF